MLNYLKPAFGDKILDIGCGTGLFAAEFMAHGAEVAGVDIESDDLAREIASEYKEKGQATFVCAVGDMLPFQDSIFTKATLLDCLEHIEDDSKVIKEVYRVLGSAGKLIITVPTYPGYPPHRLLTRLVPLLPKKWLLKGKAKGKGKTLGTSNDQEAITLARANTDEILRAFGHVRHYNEEDITRLLQGANFRILLLKRYQKMFESEMISFYFGVSGFQNPFVYPLMRLYAMLDSLLSAKYPGVGLLAVAQKV